MWRVSFSAMDRIAKVACAVAALLLAGPLAAVAQKTGPAPAGEAAVVAQKVIRANFEPRDCPLVVQASRLGDGSIKAVCNNAESFRIFRIEGRDVAMRCSVAKKLGVKGC